MVCNRCIKVVKEELEKLDIQVKTIELGKVSISENLDIDQTEKVRSVLR